MTQRYTYSIWWSAEDNAYFAKAEEFRLLITHGDTPEAALAKLQTRLEEFDPAKLTLNDLGS